MFAASPTHVFGGDHQDNSRLTHPGPQDNQIRNKLIRLGFAILGREGRILGQKLPDYHDVCIPIKTPRDNFEGNRLKI